MPTASSAAPIDRAAVLDRFRRMRARTRALFDVLDDRVYYERPIALRNPVVFYEGHLPAFAVNTLLKKGLGQPGIDDRLEAIFARGIDPDEEATAIARGNPAWPDRATVRAYVAEADRRIEHAIASAELTRDDHPLLRGAQALWTILEHEEMHQETLAYMWHQLPFSAKRRPEHYRTLPPRLLRQTVPPATRVRIPAGSVTLGTTVAIPPTTNHQPVPTNHQPPTSPFAWDNELPAHVVQVDAFEVDARNVTNAQFMAFVEAGGYRNPRWWRDEDWAWITADGVTHPPFWIPVGDAQWQWRGMFEAVPLPDTWPVFVTWAEAHAYARWQGGRLLSEPEFHRAAYGTPDGRERRYPWGETLPHAGSPEVPANFDFQRWDPDPVDAHPAGASAFGVYDLVGNGWEWTADVFAPFNGFTPMPSYPEYSAEFFDGQHHVMKGASPMTARGLVRPGFRNWFRPRYPYVYATFRCARS